MVATVATVAPHSSTAGTLLLFNSSVRTAKKTQHFTITKINWLTLFKEIITVYSENHTWDIYLPLGFKGFKKSNRDLRVISGKIIIKNSIEIVLEVIKQTGLQLKEGLTIYTVYQKAKINH
jgi:hypothetical protein